MVAKIDHCIIIGGKIQYGDMIVINLYTPNNIVPCYINITIKNIIRNEKYWIVNL